MPTRTSGWLVALTAVSCLDLAGCGGDSDQPDLPGCWPLKDTSREGSVELGTGPDTYEPMPDELELTYGSQGGYHFDVRARIRGLEPGDAIDVVSPYNPITRFQAFDETDAPIDPIMQTDQCGIVLGYAAAPDGDGFIFPPAQLRFPVGVTTGIFDKQYRVVVEVIDIYGHYARDEKLVIARGGSAM